MRSDQWRDRSLLYLLWPDAESGGHIHAARDVVARYGREPLSHTGEPATCGASSPTAGGPFPADGRSPATGVCIASWLPAPVPRLRYPDHPQALSMPALRDTGGIDRQSLRCDVRDLFADRRAVYACGWRSTHNL